MFQHSLQDPNNFESKFRSCIRQFQAGGFPSLILGQLNGAEVVINYQKGPAEVVNPTPNGNSAGQLLYLHWDPNISGTYSGDKAQKEPCAVLLHELQHAGRFFLGKECTGSFDGNEAAYAYDEKMGARAENWWLNHLHMTQRAKYGSLPLDRWTKWPASSSAPVPPAPRCIRQCTAKPALVSTADPDSASASRCARELPLHELPPARLLRFRRRSLQRRRSPQRCDREPQNHRRHHGILREPDEMRVQERLCRSASRHRVSEGSDRHRHRDPEQGFDLRALGARRLPAAGHDLQLQGHQGLLHQRAVPAHQSDRAAAVAENGAVSGRSVDLVRPAGGRPPGRAQPARPTADSVTPPLLSHTRAAS